jgi:hemoglobin
MQTLYEALGGREGVLRLAHAWHSRVLADEVVSHAFSHGFHPQHTERLAAYWVEALGGPNDYSATYGDETSVVKMHSGNGPHEEMDRRAIACFDRALEDVGVTAEPLRRVLHDYFAWATTTSMSRYHESAEHVPKGLIIPKWSWDGLVVHPTVAKLAQRLAALGLRVEVRELAASTRTAADAAAALGCEVGQIVKSLVFVVDGEPAMVLCAGDRRVDTARLGAGARAAKADEARTATGFAIGGIPPLGHDRKLATWFDPSLRRFDSVWCAAGTPNAVFSARLVDLQKALGDTREL